jgi:potassium-transporting ATPase KdpC subunit
MRNLKTSLLMLGIFSLLLGVVYPLAITGIAGLVWPHQVNGSMVRVNGRAVGSLLIGQQFSSQLYFHGRPSECAYDAMHSAGLNLGPSNPQLLAQVHARIDSIRTEDGMPGDAPVPADLALASGSGLDPDISPASALLQVGRVAGTRNLEPALVRSLILRSIDHPFLGVFGQPRVNVLKLNLALDSMTPRTE